MFSVGLIEKVNEVDSDLGVRFILDILAIKKKDLYAIINRYDKWRGQKAVSRLLSISNIKCLFKCSLQNRRKIYACFFSFKIQP